MFGVEPAVSLQQPDLLCVEYGFACLSKVCVEYGVAFLAGFSSS